MENPVKTLPLQYPIKWGKNHVIDVLEFRRTEVGDLRAIIGKDEMDAGLILLARITGLTDAQIDRMDMEDMQEAMEIAKGFMPKSQENGEESSDSSPTE